MNWKKLILFGLLFWVIIFAVWSIVIFIPGISETWEWVVGLVANAVVALFLTKWYFKSAEGDRNFGKGLLVGLGMLVVATILELAITVPLFIKGDYAGFYGQWQMWLGFVIILVFAGMAGVCKCKKCCLGTKEDEPKMEGTQEKEVKGKGGKK